jgi:hypothetical protein
MRDVLLAAGGWWLVGCGVAVAVAVANSQLSKSWLAMCLVSGVVIIIYSGAAIADSWWPLKGAAVSSDVSRHVFKKKRWCFWAHRADKTPKNAIKNLLTKPHRIFFGLRASRNQPTTCRVPRPVISFFGAES